MKCEMTLPSLNYYLFMKLVKRFEEKRIVGKLTEREQSCLLLAANGMTTDETAELLGIKASTVETYRKKIKKKLACTTMAQAVFEGMRSGYFKTYKWGLR